MAREEKGAEQPIDEQTTTRSQGGGTTVTTVTTVTDQTVYDVELDRVSCWIMRIPAEMGVALGGPGATCFITIGMRDGHGIVAATGDALWCEWKQRNGRPFRGQVVIRKVSAR